MGWVKKCRYFYLSILNLPPVCFIGWLLVLVLREEGKALPLHNRQSFISLSHVIAPLIVPPPTTKLSMLPPHLMISNLSSGCFSHFDHFGCLFCPSQFWRIFLEFRQLELYMIVKMGLYHRFVPGLFKTTSLIHYLFLSLPTWHLLSCQLLHWWWGLIHGLMSSLSSLPQDLVLYLAPLLRPHQCKCAWDFLLQCASLSISSHQSRFAILLFVSPIWSGPFRDSNILFRFSWSYLYW